MMRTLMCTLALVPILVGCSQVPKPATWMMNYQRKMQAAHHWQVLARDVACQVAQQYAVADTSGIHVEPTAGVFGEAFANLLTTELVKFGVPVASQPAGAATLTYEVQLVKHRAGFPHRYDRTQPGFWTAIGTGVRVARNISEKHWWIPGGVMLDLVAGTHTTLPASEVLITTSLSKDGSYVMRRSDLYYVNDADCGQYKAPAAPKTLEVVAR